MKAHPLFLSVIFLFISCERDTDNIDDEEEHFDVPVMIGAPDSTNRQIRRKSSTIGRTMSPIATTYTVMKESSSSSLSSSHGHDAISSERQKQFTSACGRRAEPIRSYPGGSHNNNNDNDNNNNTTTQPAGKGFKKLPIYAHVVSIEQARSGVRGSSGGT